MDDGEIKVLDCPAEEMWADVMTKPLQGTVFRIMRAELMNCPINYEDPEESTNTKCKHKNPISAGKTVLGKLRSLLFSRHCRSVLGKIRFAIISQRWTNV